MNNYLWKTEPELGIIQMPHLLVVDGIYWFGKKMMENGKYYETLGFLIKRNSLNKST